MSDAVAIYQEGLKLAVPIVKQFEGLRLERYPDTRGVLTIGYGTTASELGHDVPDYCTEAQAADWLIDGLEKIYTPWILKLLEDGIKLTSHMVAALASLSYNEGPGVSEWQIGDDLRRSDFAAASEDFLRYAIPSVLRGRRIAERAVFDTRDAIVKPADPHHYEWYPTDRMSYKGVSFIERSLAEDVDGWLEHPHLHKEKLEQALPLVEAAAKRIWVVSVYEGPDYKVKRKEADWGDHRGQRYQAWGKRKDAIGKVIA